MEKQIENHICKQDSIINNEMEWRRYMMNKVDNIEKRLTPLEMKVYATSIVSSIVFAVLLKFIGK